MKRIIALTLAGMVLFSIFGCSKKSEEEDSSVIKLNGNPTTGYEWKVTIEDTSVAKVSEEYTPDDKSDEAVGSGGTYTFTFEGLKEGETKAVFNYLRSWEAESLQTKTYLVTVDKDLNVSLKEEKAFISTVSLEADSDSGYVWEVSIEDKQLLTVEEEYISEEGGESCKFTFTGLKSGETVVSFNYVPKEGGGLSKDTRVFSATIDEDLNVNMAQTCNCE